MMNHATEQDVQKKRGRVVIHIHGIRTRISQIIYDGASRQILNRYLDSMRRDLCNSCIDAVC